MTRRRFIAGNWKLHLAPVEARQLALALREKGISSPGLYFAHQSRSVPKLGRSRSEMKSATFPAAGTSQIGRTLTFCPRSGTD